MKVWRLVSGMQHWSMETLARWKMWFIRWLTHHNPIYNQIISKTIIFIEHSASASAAIRTAAGKVTSSTCSSRARLMMSNIGITSCTSGVLLCDICFVAIRNTCEHTSDNYILRRIPARTSKSGNSFSRSSHSFFDNWKRFKRADRGWLCCSDMTNRLRASRNCSARSKSSAVLFHLVATSRTIRTALILFLRHALSRSVRNVGLLNIRLARFRSWSNAA